MLSTWVAPSKGHADFYGWDGSYLRTLEGPGTHLASIDGRYFVNFTTNQLWSSTGQLVRDFTEPTDQGSSQLNWASDGDYFCGLEHSRTGYWLVVEDVAGNVQVFSLDVPADLIPSDGLRDMGIDCSLTVNRAVVYGGSIGRDRAALMSLPDGRLVTDFEFDPGYGGAGSPDLHWLAATSWTGVWNTEVIDLTSGTVQARLTGYFGFTPDSQRLIGADGQGLASVVDWRTKAEVWRGPGELDAAFYSDPSTNKMLLRLTTGSIQAGTVTYDYWIVDGTGSGFRFTPRGCASIEESPTRPCFFS